MLSRTADSLYWTARYMERADFTARILDAASRLASLPASQSHDPWSSAIESSGVSAGFYAKYETPDERSVRQFLAFDPDNPSSIRSCLEAARANARSVRTALTMELWEAINEAWIDLKTFEAGLDDREKFGRFLDWVKSVSLAFDGAAYRTMLRNDAYWFLRIGDQIERADNTARLLDVKYHLLLPEGEEVGGGLDYFQWTTLLREVSALTAYRWVYRESIQAWLVADLLILNRQMPRSLASCQAVMVRCLDQIAEAYGRRGAAQRLASARLARLSEESIERIFQSGLHEFIAAFIDENNRLGAAITEQYLV
ncbi:MAG: A alpha-helical domain with a conserved ER moti [Caulobacterales bacterium 32-69-10]|nr:MAG: A alpha-helical domain with a conserved ER moti [Caulobacterales bacterium 32-69-10]